MNELLAIILAGSLFIALVIGLHSYRCSARKNRQPGMAYWGRCDLKRGHSGPHELERGFETIYWENE